MPPLSLHQDPETDPKKREEELAEWLKTAGPGAVLALMMGAIRANLGGIHSSTAGTPVDPRIAKLHAHYATFNPACPYSQALLERYVIEHVYTSHIHKKEYMVPDEPPLSPEKRALYLHYVHPIQGDGTVSPVTRFTQIQTPTVAQLQQSQAFGQKVQRSGPPQLGATDGEPRPIAKAEPPRVPDFLVDTSTLLTLLLGGEGDERGYAHANLLLEMAKKGLVHLHVSDMVVAEFMSSIAPLYREDFVIDSVDASGKITTTARTDDDKHAFTKDHIPGEFKRKKERVELMRELLTLPNVTLHRTKTGDEYFDRLHELMKHNKSFEREKRNGNTTSYTWPPERETLRKRLWDAKSTLRSAIRNDQLRDANGNTVSSCTKDRGEVSIGDLLYDLNQQHPDGKRFILFEGKDFRSRVIARAYYRDAKNRDGVSTDVLERDYFQWRPDKPKNTYPIEVAPRFNPNSNMFSLPIARTLGDTHFVSTKGFLAGWMSAAMDYSLTLAGHTDLKRNRQENLASIHQKAEQRYILSPDESLSMEAINNAYLAMLQNVQDKKLDRLNKDGTPRYDQYRDHAIDHPLGQIDLFKNVPQQASFLSLMKEWMKDPAKRPEVNRILETHHQNRLSRYVEKLKQMQVERKALFDQLPRDMQMQLLNLPEFSWVNNLHPRPASGDIAPPQNQAHLMETLKQSTQKSAEALRALPPNERAIVLDALKTGAATVTTTPPSLVNGDDARAVALQPPVTPAHAIHDAGSLTTAGGEGEKAAPKREKEGDRKGDDGGEKRLNPDAIPIEKPDRRTDDTPKPNPSESAHAGSRVTRLRPSGVGALKVDAYGNGSVNAVFGLLVAGTKLGGFDGNYLADINSSNPARRDAALQSLYWDVASTGAGVQEMAAKMKALPLQRLIGGGASAGVSPEFVRAALRHQQLLKNAQQASKLGMGALLMASAYEMRAGAEAYDGERVARSGFGMAGALASGTAATTAVIALGEFLVGLGVITLEGAAAGSVVPFGGTLLGAAVGFGAGTVGAFLGAEYFGSLGERLTGEQLQHALNKDATTEIQNRVDGFMALELKLRRHRLVMSDYARACKRLDDAYTKHDATALAEAQAAYRKAVLGIHGIVNGNDPHLAVGAPELENLTRASAELDRQLKEQQADFMAKYGENWQTAHPDAQVELKKKLHLERLANYQRSIAYLEGLHITATYAREGVLSDANGTMFDAKQILAHEANVEILFSRQAMEVTAHDWNLLTSDARQPLIGDPKMRVQQLWHLSRALHDPKSTPQEREAAQKEALATQATLASEKAALAQYRADINRFMQQHGLDATPAKPTENRPDFVAIQRQLDAVANMINTTSDLYQRVLFSPDHLKRLLTEAQHHTILPAGFTQTVNQLIAQYTVEDAKKSPNLLDDEELAKLAAQVNRQFAKSGIALQVEEGALALTQGGKPIARVMRGQ